MTQNPYPGPPPGYQPPPYPGASPASPYGDPMAQGYPQPQQQQPAAPEQQGPPPGMYAPYGSPAAQQPFQPPAGPNPFTQAGPAGAPPAAGQGDPFGAPGAPTGGGGDQPALHQLGGRLLLIRPLSFNPTGQKPHPSNPANGPSALVIAEMIVCDGEAIAGSINGETEQFTPFAAGPKQVPFYCGSMYISGAVLPGQLEGYVSGRGLCLARLVKGTPGKAGKPPWILADPTEQDKVLGREIFAQWDQIKSAGQQARPDQFGPPQGQQAPPQHAYGQPGQQPGYAQQAPAGYPQPSAPPAQQQYPAQGQPQGYPQQPQAPAGPPPGYPPY